jgi:hypothetical protein
MHRDPRHSSRAIQSLPSGSARSGVGIRPSKARTKNAAWSNLGGARKVRVDAGRSPHRTETAAGAQAPEVVEEATTATATTI